MGPAQAGGAPTRQRARGGGRGVHRCRVSGGRGQLLSDRRCAGKQAHAPSARPFKTTHAEVWTSSCRHWEARTVLEVGGESRGVSAAAGQPQGMGEDVPVGEVAGKTQSTQSSPTPTPTPHRGGDRGPGDGRPSRSASGEQMCPQWRLQVLCAASLLTAWAEKSLHTPAD